MQVQTNILSNPNKQYVLSISYGKDSLACLGAIEKLKLPLDRIIHAEVWATDTIPADLPPMVDFKKKADRIIKDRWGIQVEHFCAIKRERERERATRCSVSLARELLKAISIPKLETQQTQNAKILYTDSHMESEHGATVGSKSQHSMSVRRTYETDFYKFYKRKQKIRGFPMVRGNWCHALKMSAIRESQTAESG